MAALILALNQIKFCELHSCQPRVEWGPFPACKYSGVRFPGRTPFFDASYGRNAFLYFFRQICAGSPATQEAPPSLSCDQREELHRVLPWAVRTYYYGVGAGAAPALGNGTYDEAWYSRQRTEGARLVRTYLRLQPAIASRLSNLSLELLGSGGDGRHGGGGGVSTSGGGGRHKRRRQRGSTAISTHLASSRVTTGVAPVLGVHLRGTDKGRYIGTAGSGRAIGPAEYEPYVRAFLKAHGPEATVFVATDSPSFLAEVLAKWPAGRVRYRRDVLRLEANAAFAKSAPRSTKGNYRKGEEVLLDALLLARCDFLLHAASGVAEFAIYWSPRLHAHSVHMQYEHERQQPSWFKGVD